MSAGRSAILFREGPDLETVLTQLDDEHAGQVRVVDVSYDRDGGVLGFFARRRVHVQYTVDEVAPDPAPASVPAPLEDLLRAAEAEESAGIVRSGINAAAKEDNDAAVAPQALPNLDFAQMLLEIAAAKRAAAAPDTARASTYSANPPAGPPPQTAIAPTAIAPTQPAPSPPAPAPPPMPSSSAVPPPPRPPVTLPARPPNVANAAQSPVRRRPVGAHRAATDDDAGRTEFTLRRQLVEIGVPVGWIPERTADAYWAVEQLAARVPAAPPLDLGPGEILVVAGPAVEALRAARQLCVRLHLEPDTVYAAGCPAGGVTAGRSIGQRWQAAATGADIRRERREPAVVVLATDCTGDEGSDDTAWVAGLVSAVAPDRLWVVVDAGHKPADARALVHRIGRVDALVVCGAARTASPASVWELDVPIALVDGRPSGRGAWAVLLIDKLAALEG